MSKDYNYLVTIKFKQLYISKAEIIPLLGLDVWDTAKINMIVYSKFHENIGFNK